jgi:DNA-directed RNA polymerase specialized sigma24 family protein
MPQRTNKPRSITVVGFSRLLDRLHSDKEVAAEEYERLRGLLVKFFDWRGAWPSDECADEVMDRLARKLEQETTIEDVQKYVYGIARLVLLEWQRRPPVSSIDSDPALAEISSVTPSEPQQMRTCFDQCLAEFPAESRTVILDYYEGERAVKISNRRQLAASLGLSDNALRSRVQRLRERLEACIHQCLARST